MTPKPERLARATVYQSRWVNLYVDRVQFPNGLIIEKHHLLDFDHNAVIMVVRDAEGRYLMVKVCRYTTGRTEWEFPAGGMEDGEEIIAAGVRELLEETGYHSEKHEILYSYYPMSGIANKVFHVMRCQVTDCVGLTDTREISDVGWFSVDEVWGMIRGKEITDGYTLTAFLLDQHL